MLKIVDSHGTPRFIIPDDGESIEDLRELGEEETDGKHKGRTRSTRTGRKGKKSTRRGSARIY